MSTSRAKYAGSYTDMPEDELAQLALEGYEEATAELHRRIPHLAGFHSALMVAMAADREAYEAEHGIDLNRPVETVQDSAGTAAIAKKYRDGVRNLATG